MTTSSSSDVKAANSKLAVYLRSKEEEEALLQIGKRKTKKQITNDGRLPGGRARWASPPDFKSPTPLVDRPRTINGSTSFHFSYITISKKAVPTVGGAPIEGKFGNQKAPALEHSKYIERDGAAEVSQGAEHATYVERPEAVESLDPSRLVREAIERSIADVINETPTDAEAAVIGAEQEAIEGIPSVFSNISDDPFERQEYWRAVERCEREPKTHQIYLDPETAAAWWAELETTDRLDAGFKNHALMVLEKYRQYLEMAKAATGPIERFSSDPYSVSSEKAGKLIEQARRMPGYDENFPPLEFKSGRGGRVQIRFVAELPHELSAEDRALIVQNFCDHLGGLEERKREDGTVEKVGLMYTAVVHAPDAHNDRRNYHLHIVAHDRPAKYLEDEGMWDFEVAVPYDHKGEQRVRYPHRQNKIGEVARADRDKGNHARAGRNFIPTLRSKFASITNMVLKARGSLRQFDPRKYVDMGIDRTPTEHLGTKAAALEAIGVPTTVGQLNAIAIWNDAERAIARQAREANKAFTGTQQELERLARGATAADAKHPTLAQYRALVVERERTIKDVADDRQTIMTFDHLEAKAKSRAIRTRQTCLQMLADIENGKADGSTRVMKRTIQQRWKAAQDHLAAIDKDLQPHREALAAAARDIEARERRLKEIDTALQPLRADLEQRVQEAAATGPKKDPKGQAEASAPSTPAASDLNAPDAAGGAPAPAVDAAASDAPPPVLIHAEQAKAPFVPVQPASIEGLPIIQPTIAPKQDQSEVAAGKNRETPKGLTPLRPVEVTPPTTDAPEMIIPDFTGAAPAPTAKRGGNAPSADGAGAVPPASGEAQPGDRDRSDEASKPEAIQPQQPDRPEASPPKVDGRKKQTDPALFNLPEQQAPVKPGTNKAEYKAWDDLMNRIAHERIPVKVERLKSGGVKFTVPSLDEKERTLLAIPRLAHRTSNRLAAMYEHHEQEAKRLIGWIKTHGQSPNMLIIRDRMAGLGPEVRPAVKTLMKNWGTHPLVGEAIRAENDRRVEAANVAAARPKPQPEVPVDEQARREEAARMYPTPDNVRTPLVREFVTLLHDGASNEKLQAAADKIYADPAAREDVNRSTVELATAYHRYVEGVDARKAQRDRNGRNGR